MRDAQSKLDQVIAFTGKTITGEDVATVLGLVGRDLLLDGIQAVADEDATAAFTLAGRAVEMGYDLRAVCRELSRVVRDLLVLAVDPSRISDPEIAGEGERERLTALAARFSREDLLRAFDLLTRTEAEIRSAAQPRYHLEMALLLSRSNTSEIENLGGWLTTVVARVSLNMLRSRKTRREQPLGVHIPDPIVDPADGTDPVVHFVRGVWLHQALAAGGAR